MLVSNKTFVVTGGGSGIGRALVAELLARDARVFAVDQNADGLEQTRTEIGADADTFATATLDVTDKAGVEALPEHVIEAFGSVDGLINNAGVSHPRSSLVELEHDRIELVMDVNFYGTLRMTKAFLPHLLERPDAHVANISSLVALNPTAGQIMYASSKAAIKAFTETLALDLADTNVNVTLILPGVVRSNFVENSGLLTASGEDPAEGIPQMNTADAAKKMVKGIERNKTRLLIGRDIKAVDVMARVSPRGTSKLMARVAKSLLPDE